MRSVLLRLEGPLQSWGTQGRFGVRDTEREPSKSGVIGLVGSALGMARDDEETLSVLRTLTMAIRVEREGTLLSDYHTVGGGSFLGRPHTVWPERGKTALTRRFYLADASFLVALGTEDALLVERVANALKDPVWPVFLGRRACVPSTPIFEGLVDAPPEEAVRSWPLREASRTEEDGRLRLVLESATAEGSAREDVPLSFVLYARQHGRRYVHFDYIDSKSIAERAR